ncbi:MAG: sulfite exporter TauE/SafE family protein, partial [Pseudomonadales bacterium]|nr:sulfite exporter TauE/SafE family protein [Pseudomonadales bacterium]
MVFLLTIATLITSIVSGVLSMAGGMILMGVFGFFLSVPAAMVLHGVAQAASNGSRIWLHRHHLKWHILPPYFLGALLVLGLFTLVSFVPAKGLLFLLLVSFPF